MTHAQALAQLIKDLERPFYQPVAYFEAFDGAEQHACAHAAAHGDPASITKGFSHECSKRINAAPIIGPLVAAIVIGVASGILT